MTLGPTQVLVVGFAEPQFSGEILEEFSRLEDSGIVRLIDVMLVARDEAGDLDTLELPEGSLHGMGEVAAALFAAPDDAPADATVAAGEEAAQGVWSLADAIAPGTLAAVALVEHVWAGPLQEAIARAGGQPLDETWLGAADRELLEALLTDEPGASTQQ